MCGSHKNKTSFCCPEAQIFTEEICGNLNGPISVPPPFPVWTAPTTGGNDYIQGTFSVFNAGPAPIIFQVTFEGGNTGDITVPAGTTRSVSVNNPTSLLVIVPDGTHGTFCITLYKRIFA